MNCKACNKELQEGNLVRFMYPKQVNNQLTMDYMSIVLCDACIPNFRYTIISQSKVTNAEIIKDVT
jgi:hypothetical protein